jgi:glutathione S-transferase
MPRYKLTYFDLDGGRGEHVRIAFHIGGIEFEDNRISFAQFGEMRGGIRFNAVPVLEIDGAAITQSNAMGRYIGRLTGLYPEDEMQALYCDETLEALEDLTFRIAATMRLEGDAQESAREALAEGWIPVFLKGLAELLERGGGQYFADDRLTIADLRSFVQMRWLQSGALDHIPADIVANVAPSLVAHRQRVESDPRVTAYYASRK